MSELPVLVKDLALILILAGLMSLLFKYLKQPLVLGYIVAGMIAGPNMPFSPSVIDMENVRLWADIGVIFLLFSLGLEFRFKKLLDMGGAPLTAAFTIVILISLAGAAAGFLLGMRGWNLVYLGGMLSMSSTTIIYKAFRDAGLIRRKFARLVLSVLIIEDLIAVALIVSLSTLAASKSVEGEAVFRAVFRLIFFLIIWFLVGLYAIPLLMRRVGGLLNEEILLIVSLSLCFLMVVLASKAGFSPAFGAFVMGSILSETLQADKIEKVTRPVKNLFGAIFFVSVGMMVDPQMIAQHWEKIVVLSAVVLIGHAVFSTGAFILAGEPITTSIRCGFSLAQVGEFAFIIAGTGAVLGVISGFMYPVIVSVSVLTTFTTPYMIKASVPISLKINKALPDNLRDWLDRYMENVRSVSDRTAWIPYLKKAGKMLLIYSVVCLAILILSERYLKPFLIGLSLDVWSRITGALITLAVMAPFLRCVALRGAFTLLFNKLWREKRGNRPILLTISLVRLLIACGFVMEVVLRYFHLPIALLAFVVILVILATLMSRRLRDGALFMEKRLSGNLSQRETKYVNEQREKKNETDLSLPSEIHISSFIVPEYSRFCGKSLKELDLRNQYGVQVVSVWHEDNIRNIPGANQRIQALDVLKIMGTNPQLDKFSQGLGPDLEC